MMRRPPLLPLLLLLPAAAPYLVDIDSTMVAPSAFYKRSVGLSQNATVDVRVNATLSFCTAQDAMCDVAAADRRYTIEDIQDATASVLLLTDEELGEVIAQYEKQGRTASAVCNLTRTLPHARKLVVAAPLPAYVEVGGQLRAKQGGRYFLVLSACGQGSKALLHGTARFADGAGAMGGGMFGVIPFYGVMAVVYLTVAVLYARAQAKFTASVITLQRLVLAVLCLNLVYAVLAFAYYLRLNLDTDASAREIYGGIYAGFYLWSPFAILVATFHMLLSLFVECVLTLACDGVWVLFDSRSIPYRSVAVCVVLTVSKVLLIALQPQMYTLSPHLAPLAKMSVSALWAVYLLVSTLCARRSLSRPVASHLDRGTVSVHANAELKRALFKRIGCAVGAYPVIAAAAFFLFLFVRSWRWRWIRLVLFDLWMASVIMPSAYQWWPDDGGGRYAPLTQEIDATADVFGDMPDRVEIVSADDDDLGMGMGMGMMELPARHTARSPFEDDLV